MSNLINLNNGTGSFKPIFTNITNEEFLQKRNNNESLSVKNGFIISIPQDEEGNDIQDKGSIWLTDSNGYLYQLTKPIEDTI